MVFRYTMFSMKVIDGDLERLFIVTSIRATGHNPGEGLDNGYEPRRDITGSLLKHIVSFQFPISNFVNNGYIANVYSTMPL